MSDRDFAQEFLAVASIRATHLSRLAADLARWTDESLGWAELDEAYATGSSMMPQKRNPDTAELARGKAARVAGDFVALTAVLQGLPARVPPRPAGGQGAAFDAADTLELVLPALTGAVATIRFDAEAMRAACAAEGLYATDLAEALVRDGRAVPRGPPPHRRAAEAARRRTAARSRPHRRRSGRRSGAGGAALLDPDRERRGARTIAGRPVARERAARRPMRSSATIAGRPAP